MEIDWVSLWIYGKRTFFRFFTDLPLIAFYVLAGSGKTIFWLAITQLLHIDELSLPCNSSIVQDVVTLSETGSASIAYLSAQSDPRRDILSRLYLALDNGENKPRVTVMIR